MAFPMVILFEIAVLVAHIHDKRKAERKAADRADDHLEDHVPSSIDPIPAPLEPARSITAGPAATSRSDSWSDIT